MLKVRAKIVLRQYPKTFEWESLENWNERTNEELKRSKRTSHSTLPCG